MWLRTLLGVTEPLHLYIRSSFSPSPEEYLGALQQCYCVSDTDPTLIVGYALRAVY